MADDGPVLPGTVLVVRDRNVWAWWVRLGAWLRRQPHRWNHVLIAHHIDDAGTYWGIEGRPNGGVGWRDLHDYLGDPDTIDNREQLGPSSEGQRRMICEAAFALLPSSDRPMRYDWPAIVVDGLRVVDPLYGQRDQWGPGVPTQVVCSSMADYVYERVGLATPDPDRFCTPADWASWIQRRGWTTR